MPAPTSPPPSSRSSSQPQANRHGGSRIHLDGVSFTYPAASAATLTDVSFTAGPGQVTGLIGENGAGKSTVLALVAGHQMPTAGNVTAPPSLRFLSQRPAGGFQGTVTTAIERAVAPVRALETRLHDLAEHLAAQPEDEAVADAWDRILAAAGTRGLWDLDARIATVLCGLGLADLPRDRGLREISGGQRRRLDLAMVLLEHPDALVLDEPTNHLDDDAADFLTAELQAWTGPVLVASHDRWFLDHAAGQLVDLDPALDPHGRGGRTQGTAWSGNFTDYLRQRQTLRVTWEQRFADQEEELQRWRAEAALESADVFHRTTAKSEARIAQKFYSDRAATTLTRRSRNARRRIEELERNAVLPPPRPLRFGPVATPAEESHAGAGPAVRPPVMEVTDVGVKNRLRPTTFTLTTGDHLLLTGPNGAGKSTLLSMLGRELTPDTGHLWIDPTLRITTLAQEESGQSAHSGHALTPGQRRRDELQAILDDPPDVLLLDEPTNHLALGLVEDLEVALEHWTGTLVLCTHDRWVRRRWKGSRLHLEPADA